MHMQWLLFLLWRYTLSQHNNHCWKEGINTHTRSLSSHSLTTRSHSSLSRWLAQHPNCCYFSFSRPRRISQRDVLLHMLHSGYNGRAKFHLVTEIYSFLLAELQRDDMIFKPRFKNNMMGMKLHYLSCSGLVWGSKTWNLKPFCSLERTASARKSSPEMCAVLYEEEYLEKYKSVPGI